MKAIKFVAVLVCLSLPQASFASGRDVYEEHCLACHQSKGGGVPFFQPSLRGSFVIAGDKKLLIDFVLHGTETRENRESEYDNVMPSFNELSDEELAEVLSYIRKAFGNEESKISEEEVAAVRSGF